MRSKIYKGWDCFSPEDENTVILQERTPCLTQRRRECEQMKFCLKGIYKSESTKAWFKKCKYVEIKLIHMSGMYCPPVLTILTSSKIKFKD